MERLFCFLQVHVTSAFLYLSSFGKPSIFGSSLNHYRLPTTEATSHSPNPFCIVNGCGEGPIWMGSQFLEMLATRSITKHDMPHGTQ